MIIKYNNGNEFINDNHELLDQNKYSQTFFYLDAKVLDIVDKKNYCFKVVNNKDTLLAIKKEPYNLLIYGCINCMDELLLFLKENNYEFDEILMEEKLGDYLLDNSKSLINKEYYLEIGMDFMEASTISFPSSDLVSIPSINDLDNIYKSFFKDCGLSDKVDKEKLKIKLDTFRVYRVDNKIVSMASMSRDTSESMRITHVYTLPEYRGMGYARIVVNNVKNEIISSGKIATLNVDKKNPISNQLYKSLGFKKVFSQGIYKQKN